MTSSSGTRSRVASRQLTGTTSRRARCRALRSTPTAVRAAWTNRAPDVDGVYTWQVDVVRRAPASSGGLDLVYADGHVHFGRPTITDQGKRYVFAYYFSAKVK